MIFTFFFTAIVKDDPFFWCWLPRDEAIDIDCVDAGCKCGRRMVGVIEEASC